MRTRILGSPRSRLVLTRLEDRTVPAVTASLVNGILTVLGDSASNVINVGYANGQITVAGVGAFAASNVRGITVDGGDGDDSIAVSSAVTTPCLLFGGYGNDHITGGGGNDQIYGGLGDDVLTAGPGHQTLYGGAGSNTLSDPYAHSTLVRGSPSVTAIMNEMEAQIFALLNQTRLANGLQALGADPRLTAAAQLHSQNMADLSNIVGLSAALSHTLMGSPEPSVTTRADYVGFDYRILGENIAFGYQDAAAVMQGWMNSAGHRANILYAPYTSVGIGVRYTSGGVPFFTQEFGTPQTAAPIVPPPGSPPSTPPPSPNAPPPSNPSHHLVVMGAGYGGGPQVTAFNPTTGEQVFNFMAFDASFRGGVTVAAGDVNGDGYDDLVVAAGMGGGPHVKIFDGRTGELIREFMAYETVFRGGVFLAVGDVNGDGKADIITGTGVGGGPLVKIWSGNTGALMSNFYAYDSSFRGGVTVAVGDVNGDGRSDIITGPGFGGGPHVEVFDGRTGALLHSVMAFDASFRGGVTVAAGDLNGDGQADVLVGMGAGGNSAVRALDGATFAVLQSFSLSSSTLTGGVRVGCADLDGDGRCDILVAGGQGSASAAYGYNGLSLANLRTFTAFDPSFLGGVYVG